MKIGREYEMRRALLWLDAGPGPPAESVVESSAGSAKTSKR